jgi:hypothetical protein
LDTRSRCSLNRRAAPVWSGHDRSADRCTARGDTAMAATGTRARQAMATPSGRGGQVALKTELVGAEVLSLCPLSERGGGVPCSGDQPEGAAGGNGKWARHGIGRPGHKRRARTRRRQWPTSERGATLSEAARPEIRGSKPVWSE